MPKKSLTELYKVWDQKLKDSGFKDIEDRRSQTFKEHKNVPLLRYEEPEKAHVDQGYTTLAWKESVAEYFRLAGQFVHEHQFSSDKERIIWQLHAEGKSATETARLLRISHLSVKKTVSKVEALMKQAKGL